MSTGGTIPAILLVGCGRMGSAMLSGWREQGLQPSYAVDPAPQAAGFAGPDMTVVTDAAAIPPGFAPAASEQPRSVAAEWAGEGVPGRSSGSRSAAACRGGCGGRMSAIKECLLMFCPPEGGYLQPS